MDRQHLAPGHPVWNVVLEEKYIKLLVRGQVQRNLTQSNTQCLKLSIDFHLEYWKYTFINSINAPKKRVWRLRCYLFTK